jgi:hypothetical protein
MEASQLLKESETRVIRGGFEQDISSKWEFYQKFRDVIDEINW